MLLRSRHGGALPTKVFTVRLEDQRGLNDERALVSRTDYFIFHAWVELDG